MCIRDSLYLQRETCLECHKGPEDACEIHRHWFTPEEDEKYLVNKIAAAREENNDFIEAISTWWTGLPPAKRPEHVTITKIATEVLSIPIDRVSRGVQTRIGNALHRLRWLKGARAVSYTHLDVYKRQFLASVSSGTGVTSITSPACIAFL